MKGKMMPEGIDLAQAIKDYGFPIIAACGMGYFIFFIWKWVTETIDPVIGQTMVTFQFRAIFSKSPSGWW